MGFHQLDFYEFEEKEFIENNFFVENYQHFPCSLILRLKVETRKDLFAFAYELLEKQKKKPKTCRLRFNKFFQCLWYSRDNF